VTLLFGAQRPRGMAEPGEKTAASASAGRCGHQAAGRLTSIMRGSVGCAASERRRWDRRNPNDAVAGHGGRVLRGPVRLR
jgi:hypothetical protein